MCGELVLEGLPLFAAQYEDTGSSILGVGVRSNVAYVVIPRLTIYVEQGRCYKYIKLRRQTQIRYRIHISDIKKILRY